MTTPPLVGSRHELPIHGLSSEGAGVGRLADGRTVFVHRTAPGDRVRVELVQVAARWARGRKLELLHEGEGRRPAPCPHYERCGGCTLEHLTYPAQLEAKRRMVVDALERIGKVTDLPAVEAYPSPREFRYRNKVSFTLTRLRGGRVVAGFHELEEPGRIVDIDAGCLLPEEAISRVWKALRTSWGKGAERLPQGGRLRLTLRAARTGKALLFIQGGTDPGASGDLLPEVPGLEAIWWAPSGEGRAPRLVAGDPRIEDLWYGERVELRPKAFLQVNREAATHLHDLVLREVGSPRGLRIVDAYCGIGVYGRRLAIHGAASIGIEADPEAVAVGRERPVDGFRIVEGPVERHLPGLLPADRVILNPPRSGVASEVTRILESEGPERLIYVSCDPATLARDLSRMRRSYRIERLQLFDLFPQTAHVETVLTLSRE